MCEKSVATAAATRQTSAYFHSDSQFPADTVREHDRDDVNSDRIYVQSDCADREFNTVGATVRIA